MVFEELNRIPKTDCAVAQPSVRHPIPQNPHAKPKPRRLRRAEAQQARLEARNRSAAVNKNIGTIKQLKKLI